MRFLSLSLAISILTIYHYFSLILSESLSGYLTVLGVVYFFMNFLLHSYAQLLTTIGYNRYISRLSTYGLKPPQGRYGQPNQRKEAARHEYFFPLSMLETALGGRKAAARGGLFSLPSTSANTP